MPRWQVAPEVERRNTYEAHVQDIGWALYRYAWNNDNFIQFSDEHGWKLDPKMTQTLLNAGYLGQPSLDVPLGGKLSVEELARTEKDFDVGHLTQALTRHRMARLAEALVQYSAANKAAWYKDGR